ncbi:hypothetical protein K2P47_01015 [Patescibacteria group bacterium]|nr:hypothetical protein [Patescibacteria group bacterium]
MNISSLYNRRRLPVDIDIKAHIKMVQHPNPTRRSYHVVRDVCPVRHYGFGQDNFFSSLDEKKKPGAVALALSKALEQIPGVSSGSLSQYEISVGIGDAFDWADISPFVVGAIIKHIFPEVDGKTIEISTNVGHTYRVPPSSFGFGEDDGQRIKYEDVTKRYTVAVDLGNGRPRLDVEFLFSPEAQNETKKQAVEQDTDIKKH